MASIKQLLLLIASASVLGASSDKRDCGSVNVFYTGFPPYHPQVAKQGWDLARVDKGLRTGVRSMIDAGYNVYAVWAGTEVDISKLEDRIEKSEVAFDLTGIGFGVRGATDQPVVERLEDLIDLFKRKVPEAYTVFNYNPESFLWSVQHRLPMKEDCAAVRKPGRLLGYEEICDEDICTPPSPDDATSAHMEL